MKSFVKFLWTGFGTGTDAGRAVGIAILILLSVVIVVWYLISFIVKLIRGNKTVAAQSTTERENY